MDREAKEACEKDERDLRQMLDMDDEKRKLREHAAEKVSQVKVGLQSPLLCVLLLISQTLF